jgi:hypothetical protein
MRSRLLLLPWLLGLVCAAPAVCASRETSRSIAMASRTKSPSPREKAGVARQARGRFVAGRASRLVGASLAPYRVPDDCSGLVRLAYHSVGVELLSQGVRPGENAASAMYRRARRAGALHRRRPLPGDIVFFHETYDRNRDGLRNDGLTHVGIIESVAKDGTVVFVHRAGAGVVRSHMNLRRPLRKSPGGRVLNDYLRQAEGGERARLTRELFVGYASASRL